MAGLAVAAATPVVRLAPEDHSEGALTIQSAHDDVAARDLCADLANATILIGFYVDAGPSEQNAGSVTGYAAARPFSQANVRLAGLVQRDALTALNAHSWVYPTTASSPMSAWADRP